MYIGKTRKGFTRDVDFYIPFVNIVELFSILDKLAILFSLPYKAPEVMVSVANCLKICIFITKGRNHFVVLTFSLYSFRCSTNLAPLSQSVAGASTIKRFC